MKIFAVEEDSIALQMLLSHIEQTAPDAEICGFHRAADAVARMESDPCDVAFLTVELSQVDGVTLAERLIQQHPAVNIVFVTACDSFPDAAFDLHASGYLRKPVTEARVRRELTDLRRPVAARNRLRVVTFGNFEVQVDGAPLLFRYQKSREMFAYLIDRKGAMCSTGELMAVLFGDDNSHKAYYHRLRSDLIDTLTACGCESVLSHRRGMLGIVVDRIDCDYYDYLNDKVELSRLYHGEYMAQYSFAEITNAELFERAKR